MMNREQIIKMLETIDDVGDCSRDCIFYNGKVHSCGGTIAKHALALIKELTEENERLYASCTELTQCCTKLETLYKIECKRVDTVKADTVRKMQEKIRAKSEYGTINISHWQLDQIAKELLED